MASVGGDDKPRIDMTPMVDLGFLLLTFFVLTVQMNEPISMKIKIPADDDPQDQKENDEKVPKERVLILLVSGKDRIYYYQGTDDPAAAVELNETNYSPEGLRTVIKEYQEKSFNNPVLKSKGFEPKNRMLIVMIKMTDDATYNNMVSVLDEMAITRQSLYNLMDITERELEMIDDSEKAQNRKSSITKSLEALANKKK
jgi:biopolymer transport protein ExbD